jgi:hypothetical protein
MSDIRAIAAGLEDLARAKAPLPAAIENDAPLLLELPRYQGPHGLRTLEGDIKSAVQSLPERRTYPGQEKSRPIRADAATLLLPESPPWHTWTERTKRLEGMRGADDASKRWYARSLLMEVAAALATKQMQSTDPFHWVEYTYHLEMDPRDPRQHTDKREILVRTALPRQEALSVGHYYDGNPESPSVEVTSPNHRYIGRVRTPAAHTRSGHWWDHFIRIDEPYEVGEEFPLSITTNYRDEETRPHAAGEIAFLGRTPSLRRLELAVRLPPALAARVQAEWRIIDNPYARPVLRESGPVALTDGWYRHVFDSPDLYAEHRLAFPNLTDPYDESG